MTGSSSSDGRTDGAAAESLFARVVVGIDGSEPGFEACRQAVRLVTPGGWLELFAAVQLGQAGRAGWSAPRVAEELARETDEAIRKAEEIAGGTAETRIVNGAPAPALLRELAEQQATLVALGTHGHSRAVEILIGGVAGELLHQAPCSVLIARPPLTRAEFPHAVAVGVDGSACSDVALAAAEYLAGRFDAQLHIVQALDEPPVAALAAASRDADLLVVGSRGLTGIKALGSVSERIAHEAACSVLVVR